MEVCSVSKKEGLSLELFLRIIISGSSDTFPGLVQKEAEKSMGETENPKPVRLDLGPWAPFFWGM